MLVLGRGCQTQQRVDARALFLGRLVFGKEGLQRQAEAEPRVRVRAEGKRRLGHMGLESIMRCKLSAGTHLLLQGVFSLWMERSSCLWRSLGLALRVKAKRKPGGRFVWGLESIFLK